MKHHRRSLASNRRPRPAFAKKKVVLASSPRRARTSSSNPPLVDVDAAIARIARGDARPTCAHPFPSARAHSRRNARRAPTVELIPAATQSLAPARVLASLARVRSALARARSTARVSFARFVRALGRAWTRARVVETCARISEATRQCAPDRRSRTRDDGRETRARGRGTRSRSSTVARSRRRRRRRRRGRRRRRHGRWLGSTPVVNRTAVLRGTARVRDGGERDGTEHVR